MFYNNLLLFCRNKSNYLKMNNVKVVAKVLLYTTRFFAAFYGLLTLYSAICLMTGWFLAFKENGQCFSVLLPLTQESMLTGANNLPYIFFDFLLPLTLYSIFFLLVSNVFKVFTHTKLFTQNGVRHLQWFYLSNLIIPSVAVLLAAMFGMADIEVMVLVMLHFVLGVFVYFLAAIFKQGLYLQNEQDLMI